MTIQPITTVVAGRSAEFVSVARATINLIDDKVLVGRQIATATTSAWIGANDFFSPTAVNPAARVARYRPLGTATWRVCDWHRLFVLMLASMVAWYARGRVTRLGMGLVGVWLMGLVVVVVVGLAAVSRSGIVVLVMVVMIVVFIIVVVVGTIMFFVDFIMAMDFVGLVVISRRRRVVRRCVGVHSLRVSSAVGISAFYVRRNAIRIAHTILGKGVTRLCWAPTVVHQTAMTTAIKGVR